MSPITSRKHAQSRFHHHVGAALAVMLLPIAAQAADDEQQKSPQTLQEVQIIGSANNSVRAESPKYTEALVNTAQTIQVIKRELIDQQGAVTLTEALRNTPGVGAFFLGENGSTNTGDAVYMRGFDTSGSIFVDGVRDVGSVSRDVFNIDQIDVLKGPAGTDNGRSAPTGSINLVSKQPTLSDAGSASVSAGSGQQKRATLDVNRVLDKDRGTALRINLMDQDSGNPARDQVKAKRWAIAPTIGFGLNGNTRVFVDYLHVKQDNVPDGGVPTIGLPGYTSPDPTRPYLANAPRVNPANFYGSSLDHDNVKADMFTVRLEHDFSPMLRLLNTTRYGQTQENYVLTSFMGTAANLKTPSPSDTSTWTLARLGTNLNFKDQENDILTNQSTVTADFSTGALAHTLVAGVELTNEKQVNYGYAASAALPAANLYQPNVNLPVSLSLARNGVYNDASTSTQSVFAFDTIKLGARWIFNGGVRLDHYSTSYTGAALSTATTYPALPVGTLVTTHLAPSDTLVNGKLSALYKPTADSSVYALVASSKLPPGGTTFALSPLASSATNPNYEPQSTVTSEIGGKWDLLKQKVSLTAAVYRTTVRNEVEQDPVDAQYYQTGKKRVQGVEVGITGEIMRNWLLSAGYSRMNTSVESGKVTTASGINNLAYTPKQAFTAWSSYSLANGLKLGGGARFVDRLLRGTDSAIGTPAYADAYWVFDAMASYSLSKNVELRLNLYNLADRNYIAAINKSGYRYTPGAPRSGSLTANFSF